MLAAGLTVSIIVLLLLSAALPDDAGVAARDSQRN